jgi:hypothetical protein
MTLITNTSLQARINNLIAQLTKINGLDSDLEVKENYDLLDLISHSDPCGDGGVYCIFETEDKLFSLQTYNGTSDRGFMPLLSNQQVDKNGYAYWVNNELTNLENNVFNLIDTKGYVSEYDDERLDIFLTGKVSKKSEEYLWYSKQDFLDIIESQLEEFPGFDFEIVKKFFA